MVCKNELHRNYIAYLTCSWKKKTEQKEGLFSALIVRLGLESRPEKAAGRWQWERLVRIEGTRKRNITWLQQSWRTFWPKTRQEGTQARPSATSPSPGGRPA